MNIENYTSYFHDGAIIDISQTDGMVEIAMESSQITDDELKDDIALSGQFTLKGKLHLEGVKLIKENHNDIQIIIKKYDSGEILDLEIKNNNMKMFLNWRNFPPKLRVEEYSTIEIEAEKIWWENIPDLHDPFW